MTLISACLITNKKAATLSIGRVVELASKRYNKSMGKELLDLYEFVKTNYNQYIEQIGGAIGAGACAAIKRGDKVYTIEDDVPVLHFLSGEYHVQILLSTLSYTVNVIMTLLKMTLYRILTRIF